VFSTNALTFPLLHLHILNLNWKYPKPFILERRKSFSFTNHLAAYSESQPEISKTFHIQFKKPFSHELPKHLEMRISMFLLPLAFLTATSYADEFPNPCKRSEMQSGPRPPARVVAQRAKMQISAKFTASVSELLGCEHQIGASYIFFFFLSNSSDIDQRERQTMQ
jgi:hypothetical protein